MKDNKTDFFDYLEKRTAEVTAEANALISEERRDEGNALKAKANIYGIFKALWDASEKWPMMAILRRISLTGSRI